MIDLIWFGFSVSIILFLVVLFLLVGLYFGKDNMEWGYSYFKYYRCGSSYYVKCRTKDLRFHKTLKFCEKTGVRYYDLSHVTWLSRKEYYAETR